MSRKIAPEGRGGEKQKLGPPGGGGRGERTGTAGAAGDGEPEEGGGDAHEPGEGRQHQPLVPVLDAVDGSHRVVPHQGRQKQSPAAPRAVSSALALCQEEERGAQQTLGGREEEVVDGRGKERKCNT